MSAKSFNISFTELPMNKDLVLRAMGYDINAKKNVPGQLFDSMAILCHQINDHLDIRAGYTLIDPERVEISRHEIVIEDQVFNSGHIINSQIRKAESIAIFAITLGHPFDQWVRQQEDLFQGYVIDTIGAELAELAADWIEAKIADEITSEQLSHSNRFSPGYCGWPLMEQHKLFSFFPDGFLDIRLNESALMTPKKSISGIYGIGKSLKKKADNCSICDSTDCYKRLHHET